MARPKYTMMATIVRSGHVWDAMASMMSATCIDMELIARVGAVAKWLAMVESKPTPLPLCLACEHEFATANSAHAFLHIMTTNRKGRVIQVAVTGICEACASGDDKELLEKSRPMLARIMGIREGQSRIMGIREGQSEKRH